MRKVKVFHNVFIQNKDDNGNVIKSFYEKQFRCNGLFHQFSMSYEELDNGIGNYPVAIIELDNGEVIDSCLHLFQFEKENS